MTALGTGGSSDEQETEAVAYRWLDALARRDVPAGLACLTVDVLRDNNPLHQNSMGSFPCSVFIEAAEK